MSFNKITVIGNLGRDPELRYTPQGDAVCDFSVAVNDRKRDKAGEFQDITTWFKVTFWRKQAENASKYLTKGKSVYVEGRLQMEEWNDRDGNKRFTLAIQGSELQFIGDPRSSDDSTPSYSSDSPAGNSSGDGDFTNAEETGGRRGGNTVVTPADDDIPF